MSLDERQKSIEDYRKLMSMNNTSGTVSHYVTAVERFEDWRQRNDHPLSLDTARQYDEFLRDYDALRTLVDSVDGCSPWNLAKPSEGGYSYRTRIKNLSAIKSWLKFNRGIPFEGVRENNVHYICEGDPPKFRPNIADDETVGEIFEDAKQCDADACHAMVVVGFDAILRCVEVTRLKWDDYDDGELYVEGAKGSNNATIELSPGAVRVLEPYRELVKERFDDPEHLFYRFSDDYGWNKPWSAGSWSRHFWRQHWEHGFHDSARHTAITMRLDDGQSLDKVSARARHANQAMTIRYLDLVSNGDYVPDVLQ